MIDERIVPVYAVLLFPRGFPSCHKHAKCLLDLFLGCVNHSKMLFYPHMKIQPVAKAGWEEIILVSIELLKKTCRALSLNNSSPSDIRTALKKATSSGSKHMVETRS